MCDDHDDNFSECEATNCILGEVRLGLYVISGDGGDWSDALFSGSECCELLRVVLDS